MQEFRPATMIAADTELARRFAQGDPDAIRELTGRYASAIGAAVGADTDTDARNEITVEVFVSAHQDPIAPGGDFGPWLADLTREHSGDVDEIRWSLAMATGAIDPEARPALRRHHLEEQPPPLDDDLARHELRLRRRLAHLGGSDVVLGALSDPTVWEQPADDIVDRVLGAITGSGEVSHGGDVSMPVGDEPVDEPGVEQQPSRVARGLRPVLFGLGAAVLVLFVAIIGLSAASGTPEPPDFTVELTPTGALADVEGGEITVTERDAGLEIELEAFTLPRRAAGLFYEARIVLRNGAAISAGTFAQGDGVTLWAGASLDDAAAFHIVAGDLDDPGVDDIVLKADLPQG